ncbi:MAG: DUF1385 domain-containing protein [Oscillospiraceae bacterium]|nr:DUF1385 domain-containing protein [Oscillospiraceae bacterium]MBQ2383173.1 DUF1385 domain-containing protein [Oscillospiraceae bacterium]MBQ5711055.1 DUF1385 domain-containing protein [Oscillospiraceae bacterium]
MAEKRNECCEKFKTMIGGQALIEGIMMRGPEKDAIVVRSKDGLKVDVKPRKIHKKGSVATWPLIRGAVGFFDSQVTGVKALMQSADLAPEEYQEEPSKLDQWLEKKLGNETFQKVVIGIAVALGLGMSIGLFFLLPMLIGSFFDKWIDSLLVLNLLEGLVRIVIFGGYMLLVSRMSEMRRVFAYHGAEHKTIRCYEAGLPLTVENVRKMSRKHPRCGTSFLLVVLILSILLFSVASSLLLELVPALAAIRGSFGYRAIMIVYKLLLLPVVVAIAYEINRWVGRHDNAFARVLTAPGMWFQNFTTFEPDDDMIEVGIAAVEAVLPEEEGADRW